MLSKMLAAAVVCALLSCNRTAPQNQLAKETQRGPLAEAATGGSVPSGLEPALWQDIRSYPASSAVISAFPNAQKLGPIISWLRSLGQGMPGWPECVAKELDKVSRYYMVQSESPDGSTASSRT